MGQHCLKTCRAATFRVPAYGNVSDHISGKDQGNMSFNILTFAEQGNSSVMNVEDHMVWVQLPCAVDSGACAHVAPPNVFTLMNVNEAQHKGKYFGADGSPIDEYGQLTVKAILGKGTEMKTKFGIAKITRPLLSVNQISENRHQVISGKGKSYIKIHGSHKQIPLRAGGRLYMLDMRINGPSRSQKSHLLCGRCLKLYQQHEFYYKPE